MGHALNDFVEASGKQAPEGAVSFSSHPFSGAAVISFLADGMIHGRQEFGRMLQVGVHNDAVISRSLFQSGIHGGFFAEIPGKGNVMAVFILVDRKSVV